MRRIEYRDWPCNMVNWFWCKSWLHFERRAKEPVKIVHCRTKEDLEKFFMQMDEEDERREMEMKRAKRNEKRRFAEKS